MSRLFNRLFALLASATRNHCSAQADGFATHFTSPRSEGYLALIWRGCARLFVRGEALRFLFDMNCLIDRARQIAGIGKRHLESAGQGFQAFALGAEGDASQE